MHIGIGMHVAIRRFTHGVIAASLAVLLWAARPVHAQFDPAREYRESDAVAARFPDPAVEIDSPAFRRPHEGFTTQEELMAHVARLSATSPRLQVRSLGVSQEGRELPILIFSSPAPGRASELARNGKPTVLIIGQQHGNEPAGGEAALALAAELAGGTLDALLERINVLIVPRANPDGAAHFVRELADGTDANRDHVLTASPEAQALARVFADYQPEVVLDCHEFSVARRWLEKFNAVQGYDAMIQFATVANLPSSLMDAAEQWFRRPLIESLEQAGYRTSWYYTTSYDPADKRVSMGGVVPDTGRNVAGLRNAVSFLIETRGVNIGRAHFKRRVATTLHAMKTILFLAAQRASGLTQLARELREETAKRAGVGEMVILSSAAAEKHELIFLDPETGAAKPVTVEWRSALRIESRLTRPRPFGYLLPASEGGAAKRLQRLGITVLQMQEAAELAAERYVVTTMDSGKKEDVRRVDAESAPDIVKLTTRLEPTALRAARGDFYVPLNQPLANLIAAALEPEAQSSFAANRILTLSAAGQDPSLPLYRLRVRPSAPMTVWEPR
jgi:hypothetical protein